MIDTEKEIDEITPVGKISKRKQDEKPVLEKQGRALRRLVDHADISVVELAKKIGVDRQSIYMWQRGIAAIPEDKLELLAAYFDVDPVEIRYDVALFNRNDLIFVMRHVENELSIRNMDVDNERKSRLVSMIYETLQEQKRVLNKNFLQNDFVKTANRTIEMFA